MKFFSSVGKVIAILVIIFFGYFWYATEAVATKMISGADIKEKINLFLVKKDFLGKPSISETRLFPACSSDIVVRPLFGGFKTIELFCPDPGGLKIAVRTNAVRITPENVGPGIESSLGFKRQNSFNINSLPSRDMAGIKTISNIFVALSRSVQKGQVLTEKDVVLKNTRATNLSGYFTKRSDVVGRKVKKTLSIHQVLLNRHLEIDWHIRKGQKILIESAFGTVVVVSSGISRNDAQIGELLQAKNLQSGALVEGIVVSKKKIKVLTK